MAPPRTAWFSDVTRWATSGMAPVDFAKCISASEVRARLATGRPHSALLIDGAAVGADRDLIAAAREGDVDFVYITLPLRAELRIKDLIDRNVVDSHGKGKGSVYTLRKPDAAAKPSTPAVT